MTLAGALAAVLLLSFAAFTWLWTSRQENEIQQLADKSTNLDKQIEKGKKVQIEVRDRKMDGGRCRVAGYALSHFDQSRPRLKTPC